MMHLMALFMALLLVPSVVYGVQLEAEVPGDARSIEPSFRFLRVVFIYGEGEELFGLLPDERVRFSVNSSTTDLGGVIREINHSIREAGSVASVTDVRIEYQATILNMEDYTRIEYSVLVTPTITDHIMLDRTDVLVDSKWRGFRISGPVVVETIQYGMFDVNDPADALRIVLPQAYRMLEGAEILSIPLLDASEVLKRPLSSWHYLFDPTSVMPGARDYGYEGSIVSVYSIEKCNVIIGVCADREWTGSLSIADKEYTIRAIEPQDDAVIQIEGYASIRRGTDMIVVTEEREEKGVGGSLQSYMMYGMSIAGVAGTAVLFWVSGRRTRMEHGKGQTGIDPSRLQVRETNTAAGSYRTNRGESHLAYDPPRHHKSRMPV